MEVFVPSTLRRTRRSDRSTLVGPNTVVAYHRGSEKGSSLSGMGILGELAVDSESCKKCDQKQKEGQGLYMRGEEPGQRSNYYSDIVGLSLHSVK